MKLYLVCAVEKHLTVITPYGEKEIPLRCHDGMCGACPVFTNKKDAEKYAEGKFKVLTMEIKQNDN